MNLKAQIKKYKLQPEPIKASLWYTVGNILTKGIALFATPIFTRMLTTNEYGTYAYYRSWIQIIMIFSTFNIFSAGYEKGLLLYKKERDKFTAVSLGLTLTITSVWFILVICFPKTFSTLLGLDIGLIFFMFVELYSEPAMFFWGARERFDFKYKKYVILSFLKAILSIILGIVFIRIMTQNIVARVLGDVLAKGFIGCVIGILLLKKGKKFFDKEMWIYCLRFNIPLLPHYISHYILNQSDRVMIGKMLGKENVGMYSIAYTIAMASFLVLNAINQSACPLIYKKLEKKDYEDISEITSPLFIFAGLISILMMLFAPEIILIFAGDKYSKAIEVVPAIAASVFFIFLYSMFSLIEYYYQETKKIAFATTCTAGINIILNYIFIPKWGIIAAGYTTLLSYIILALLHLRFCKTVVNTYICDQSYKRLFDISLSMKISIYVLLMTIIVKYSYSMTYLKHAVRFFVLMLIFKKKDILIHSIKKMIKKSDIKE